MPVDEDAPVGFERDLRQDVRRESAQDARNDSSWRSPRRLSARRAVMTLLCMLAVCVPFWSSGLSLSFASQVAAMIVLAQSFQLLLGETGLLSFGHAAYAGLGAFASAYVLNFAGSAHWPVPTPLLPLAGALAGALGGATLGWLATRRGGIAFAMITLGMAELLATGSAAWPGVFGGDGGLSTDRTLGWSPFDLGPERHAYALIAVWAVLAVVAMRALMRTPLGLAARAVREQPVRAAFAGLDVARIRYRMLIVSAAFAGVAGALATIANEHVSGDAFGLGQSGAVLVAVVLGGASGWRGPLLGTLVYMGFAVALATVTRAWPFYLGLLFIGVVSLSPGGLIDGMRIVRTRMTVMRALACLVWLAALILSVEMIYRLTVSSDGGSLLTWGGLHIDAATREPWQWAAGLWASGVAIWIVSLRRDIGR
jgi:branched-chain amino acid transport system permease protein